MDFSIAPTGKLVDLTKFFEVTYNHQRLHSALGYQTPAAFEQQLLGAINPKLLQS